MATRFYQSTSTPDISPAFDSVWNETSSAVRRVLDLDTRGDTGAQTVTDYPTTDADNYILYWQFISPSLSSISATFSAVKGVFQGYEQNAKCNAYLYFVFRKCDADGNNLETISGGSVADDVEFHDSSYASRYLGSSDLGNSSLTDGQRLIVEVGAFCDTGKDYPSYYVGLKCRDNYASDLAEQDNEIGGDSKNTWFETGDTFSEYSGGGTLTISVDDDMSSEEYINMNLYSSVLTVNVNDSLGQSEALD